MTKENITKDKFSKTAQSVSPVLLLIAGLIVGVVLGRFSKAPVPEYLGDNEYYPDYSYDYDPAVNQPEALPPEETISLRDEFVMSKYLWQEPVAIPLITKIIPKNSYAYFEESSEMYVVGSFTSGPLVGTDIVRFQTLVGEMLPSLDFFLFLKKPSGQLILLTKHASEYRQLNTREYLADSSFWFEELNYPEIIQGSTARQKLVRTGYGQAIFTNVPLVPVFTFSHNGGFETVYTTPSGAAEALSGENSLPQIFRRNGFYVERADGTTEIYELKFDILRDTGIADITWVSGAQNTAQFSGTDSGGCGSSNFASVQPLSLRDEMIQTGTTFLGEPVYEFADPNHSMLRLFYKDRYHPPYGTDRMSYEEFAASHPMFFWVDPFGRLIKFENMTFTPAAECAKPVIYLYPEKEIDISVTVEPRGGFTYTDPEYNEGWNVRATPEGKLVETKSGKTYPYLFWEGRGGIYQTPERGFVVKRAEVSEFLDDSLFKLGLRGREIADFKEYWLPYLSEAPYYFITFLGNREIDDIAPLAVEPKPDTVIRVLMDFKPLDQKMEVSPFTLRAPKRDGFTVVEWGGVKH